jgi:hypothetical protein
MKDGWPAVNNLDEFANAIMFCNVEVWGMKREPIHRNASKLSNPTKNLLSQFARTAIRGK